MEPESPRPGLVKQVLRIAISCAAVGLVGWFLVERLVRHWDEVGTALSEAPLLPLILAFVAAGAAVVGWSYGWSIALGVVKAFPPLKRVIPWYFAGEIGKYLPGGIWQFVGRGELAVRGGVGRAASYMSVALSLFQMVASAAVIASVLGPWALVDQSPVLRWTSPVVAPIVLLSLHPAFLGRVSAIGARLTRNKLVVPPMSWRSASAVVLAGIPCWLLVGATHLLLTHALGGDAATGRVMAASVVAWIIGMAVVFAPAGLGVREVTFVAIAGIDEARGVAITTAARLFFVLVDAIGAVVSFAVLAAQRGDGSSGDGSSGVGSSGVGSSGVGSSGDESPIDARSVD